MIEQFVGAGRVLHIPIAFLPQGRSPSRRTRTLHPADGSNKTDKVTRLASCTPDDSRRMRIQLLSEFRRERGFRA